MGLNLITLAEYKAYKGMASTGQDSQINALIPKVSDLVKTYCRRTFVDYVDENKVDVFKGGSDIMHLKETPVISVSSVEYSDDYGASYTSLVEFTDFVSDSDLPEQINLINSYYTSAATKKVNAFRVTYTAGYDEIPSDLKLAIMDLVTYYLRHEGALHTQKNVGANTVQIEYVTNTALPANIRRVLDLHCAHYL